MNKTNFSATLDIHDLYSQFTLHIKKGDTTGRLTVTLMEGGRPYKIVEGCYAAFSAKTADGKPIFNKCVIENNKIVHDLTLNTTAVAGKLGCELLVFGKNEELLVSPRFTIIVDDTVYNGEQIESTEEFSALTHLVSEANTLIEEVKEKLENGEFKGEQGEEGPAQDANLEKGDGTGSTQQKQDQETDVTEGYFKFKDKNPNAVVLDSDLGDEIKYGGSGDFATAFGGKSAAIGRRSFAEGTTTIAKGNYSHAEGNSTVALGQNAHAEGLQSTACELASHAEGQHTVAKGKYTHAEGYATIADSDASHAEGRETQALGAYSHAEGYNTTANDSYAHAEGQRTTASASAAHAEGQGATASGIYSHAEGLSTTASAEGAHTEGKATQASAPFAHAEGRESKAKGNFSHTEGYQTEATGQAAHAEGWTAKALANGAHAEGRETEASGPYSHAEGRGTKATKDYAHAEGQATTASGDQAHAEGQDTHATGADSHAEGKNTTASGENSHAGGHMSVASGRNSFAQGFSIIAAQAHQTAFGVCNRNNTDTIFEIGIGRDGNNRENAFEVYKDGTVKVSDKNGGMVEVATKDDLENSGGGGTKLYRHRIVCYIENTNSGSMLEINDAIITTKSTAYTDVNEAIEDYIKAGGRMVQCYNGTWLLLYNGWIPVYDGGTISTERYYDLIQSCAFSQVELNLPDEISTMSVYFQDTKVEEL